MIVNLPVKSLPNSVEFITRLGLRSMLNSQTKQELACS